LRLKLFFKFLCILLLIGCSSEEYSQAMRIYQQAKSTHQLAPLVASLKILARLEPQQYQAELKLAHTAQRLVLDANEHLQRKNYYQAYLSSHESYQTLFTVESSKIVKEAGIELQPILKAHLQMRSFYPNYSLLTDLLHYYRKAPAVNWNLAKVNALLEQLTSSSIGLTRVLNNIEKIEKGSLGALAAEVAQWQLAIEQQRQKNEGLKHELVRLALSQAADVLINLNQTLAAQSLTITSLFNRQKQKKAVAPFFKKAKKEYEDYQLLIENVALATSQETSGNYADWYQDWRQMESNILQPKALLTDYALQAESRAFELNMFANVSNLKQTNFNENTLNFNEFTKEFSLLNKLILKLGKEREPLS